MQKLTIFVVFLLLTAILCGCMAANPGNTVPTDGPTTPTTAPTQPTEPQATEPPAPLAAFEFRVEPFSFRLCDTKAEEVEEYLVVRSVDQLTKLCSGTLLEEVEKYDDAFFESNSLIVFNYVIRRPEYEFSQYIIKDLVEDADGNYEMAIDYYWWAERAFPTVVMSPEYGCFVIEVNRVLDSDALIQVTRATYLIHKNEWEGMFENEENRDITVLSESTEIQYVNRETIIAEKWKGRESCVVRSVDELKELCSGVIPEDLQKYDDAYFAKNDLLLIHRWLVDGVTGEKEYYAQRIESVSITEKGSYLVKLFFKKLEGEEIGREICCCVAEVPKQANSNGKCYIAQKTAFKETVINGE